jgi:hypothetical protein
MQAGIKVNQNTSVHAKSRPHNRFTGIRPKESLENCGLAKLGKAGRMGSQGVHLGLKTRFSVRRRPASSLFNHGNRKERREQLELHLFAEAIDSPLRVLSATLVNTEARFAGEKAPFCRKAAFSGMAAFAHVRFLRADHRPWRVRFLSVSADRCTPG